jgi:transcription initiation factor TFIID TATA-box-binding protein
MRKRKYSMLTHEMSMQCLEGAPLPMVHNIVATAQIGGSLAILDLNRIHEVLPFSFYDQHKFAAITVRLHQPDCTTLLFSSGKLVVTGCRTWYECVYASLFIAELLEECLPGHVFRLHACDVQNMVAHVEVPVQGGMLDLQAMYTHLALNCTYQRKMFPGLIYRPESSPVVLLCFFSGKIVITGGKTMDDVFSGWKMLWPTLQKFIVPYTAPASRAANSELGGHDQQGGGGVGAVHEGLPLGGDPAADDPGGGGDCLEEDAGGCGGWQYALEFTDPPILQGLCDDLAAESDPLVV